MSALRSAGAVVAGAVTGIVLSIGTDMAMRAAGVFPSTDTPMSDAMFLLATFYRTVYGVLGSYLTARLAPDRPMGHALVLGGLGLMATIFGAVETWGKGPDFGPKWYPLLLIVLTMPQSWLGGKLGERSVMGDTARSARAL